VKAMKNENLILKLIEMLMGESVESSSNLGSSLIGEPVIIRCRDAGVHFGYLVGYEGRVVELKNSRRMWRWHSASENTLSGVARCGINQSKSKIQGKINGSIILNEACEILPCTDVACHSIRDAEVYNVQ